VADRTDLPDDLMKKIGDMLLPSDDLDYYDVFNPGSLCAC
jgi:hypothetical protein